MIPLRDDRPSGRFPIQTFIITIISAYVFYLELTTGDLGLFLERYALIPVSIDFSEPVTLFPFLTALFLHGGFLHILFNMWFLWIFGDNVEAKLGLFFIPVYLAGGLLGNLIQHLVMPEIPIPILGASGAVATTLGTYMVLFPKHQIITIIPIFLIFPIVTIPATVAIVIWFLTQFFSGYASLSMLAVDGAGGVAWFAHVGGFAFGLVIGLITAVLSGTRQTNMGK